MKGIKARGREGEEGSPTRISPSIGSPRFLCPISPTRDRGDSSKAARELQCVLGAAEKKKKMEADGMRLRACAFF